MKTPSNKIPPTLASGFDDAERASVAALYWRAFSDKLGRVLGPDRKALEFLEHVINPKFAIVARGPKREILGVAGYKTAAGSLMGGGLSDLAQTYGWIGTAWRGALLAFVERPLADNVLLMDGICVNPNARGQGLGTRLLDAIKDKARDLGKTAVRLDVINTNPRARALYERQGFVAQMTETTGPLRHVFRFDTTTQMIWQPSV